MKKLLLLLLVPLMFTGCKKEPAASYSCRMITTYKYDKRPSLISDTIQSTPCVDVAWDDSTHWYQIIGQ